MPEVLHPFVYWSQTEDAVSLKIDLKDSRDSHVRLAPSNIKFAAHGKGAFGFSPYQFDLDLFSDINAEDYKCNSNPRKIDVTLKKQSKGWWPRLTSKPQKPGWLKIDFDRWKTEHDDEFEDEVAHDITRDYPRMQRELEKQEFGYATERFKTVVLVIYNLFQFVGCIFVMSVISIRYYRDGIDSMPDTYAVVGGACKFLHLLQYLEVLYPLFGYTSTNTIVVLYQKAMRSFLLLFMIEGESRMQIKPVVFYLICAWMLNDVVRYAVNSYGVTYSYYMTRAYDKNMGLLTWMKHTLWIPLHPLTTVCEGVIILRNIPYFEETKRFSIFLPNTLNISLYFPTILRIYLLFLILPTSYAFMSGMYRVRTRKLGRKKIIKED